MRLGEVISKYLEEHDMSLREFSRLSGITATNLSFIVNGKTPRGNEQAPTITTYQKIAKAMGIDTDDLVGMVDDKIAWKTTPTISPKEMELILLYRKADEIDQVTIQNILSRYKQDTSSKVG